jgi:isopentenyl-diphosphate Delta-isomerase
MEEDQLILVDENDTQTGVMGKLETHQKGLLHRAFSIFVINDRGELMLQKRAASKYHCGGLWTNTCCGHPRNGEELLSAAHRRLPEEMGFDCALQEIFLFHYQVVFDNGLCENEMNRVFVGRHNGDPIPNPGEADDWKWVKIDEVKSDIQENSDKYTYWFKEDLNEIRKRGLDLQKVV